jgi:membrane-associated phospholipid phosphatase
MKKVFFIILSVFTIHLGYSQNPDIRLLEHINLDRNKNWDPAMRALSNSTTEICVAVPAALITYSFFKKDSLNFRKSMVIGASMFTSAVITLTLKYAINRPRPFETYPYLDQAISSTTASFPSGHTSNSFALATSLSLAYPKWYVIVPSYLWASSVAYSRMHLGVHYPSDVLIGALIGAGSSFLTYKLNQLMGNRKFARWVYRNSFDRI